MKYLTYKGYPGGIEISTEDDLLFGSVLEINSLISFEGATEKTLRADFKGAIDEYLFTCENEGIIPEKPFGEVFM